MNIHAHLTHVEVSIWIWEYKHTLKIHHIKFDLLDKLQQLIHTLNRSFSSVFPVAAEEADTNGGNRKQDTKDKPGHTAATETQEMTTLVTWIYSVECSRCTKNFW